MPGAGRAEYTAQRSACHCASRPRRCTGNHVTLCRPAGASAWKRKSIQDPKSITTLSAPGHESWPREASRLRCHCCPSQRRLTGLDLTNATQSQSDQTTASPDPARAHGPFCNGRVKNQATITRITNAANDSTATRQRPKRLIETWNAGNARMGAQTPARQIRLNTSVPLVPPKPKLFLAAYSIFISRAALAQ